MYFIYRKIPKRLVVSGFLLIFVTKITKNLNFMEKKLLVLLIALLSQLCGWADVYTDPTTNIVYTYVKGSGEASIESTTNTESSGPTSEPTPTPTPTPTPVDGGVKTTQVVSGDISVLEKFTVDDEMYVVTKIGKNAFCGCSDLTSVTLPASIKSIEDYAFCDCAGIQEFSGEGITVIGENAFSNCTGLKTINLPQCINIDTRAFDGCTSVESVVLGCCTIKSEAFRGCSKLASVVMASGTNEAIIEQGAFSMCADLSSITFGEGLVSISKGVFKNCDKLTSVAFPQSLVSIGNEAFSGCIGLQTITIEDATVSIGDYAFSKCESLKEVDFGKKTIAIGESAFAYCKQLESIVIPGSVTDIGNTAFYGCVNLSSVTICEGVVSIGNGAFSHCKSLSILAIGKGVELIGEHAFAACKSLISVKIPEGVTEIGEEAFSGCSYLESVELPDDLVTIPYRLFYDCTSLRSLNIPINLAHIEEGAFIGCAMTSITIPANIESIGKSAFSSEDLIRVESEIMEPFEIEVGVFSDKTYEKGTLVVPAGTVEKYQSQVGWRDFKEIVAVGSEPQTAFSLDVSQEGTLDEQVTALNAAKIRKLTVKGRLNGTDIKFLRSENVGLDCLDSLDLRDVTLVPGGESYYTYVIPGGDGDYWSNTTYYIYLSDHEEKTHLQTTAVGWGTQSMYKWESDALPYAFYGRAIKYIALPNSLSRLGEKILASQCLEGAVVSNQVTEISDGAFFRCGKLRHIEGLDFTSVKTIGDEAFKECRELKLGSMEMNNAVTIGNEAFRDCEKIEKLVFSEKLHSVGVCAFAGCSSLYSISYDPDAPTLYGIDSFDDWWMDTLPIEDGIVYMGHCAMRLEKGKATPSTIKFKDGTLCVAHHFSSSLECKYVRQIDLPKTIKCIGDHAFNDNFYGGGDEHSTIIKSLTLPDGLIKIGSYAFSESEEILDLEIPESVELIGDRAFSDCKKLRELSLNGRIVGKGAFLGCDSLRNVTVGSKVNLLDEGAFQSCDSLEIVTFVQRPISEKLTFGDSVFMFDKNLGSIELPEGTDFIGSSAFSSCNKLNVLTIPSTVVGLGSTIYLGETIISKIQIPFPIGDDTFDKHGNLDKRTLIVPNGTRSLYSETDGWMLFKNIVEVETERIPINISSAKQVTYMSDKDLDFTGYPDLKAYVATGYDKASGTIWLTRVKEIPANTGFLLMGEANTYEIPVKAGGLSAYYQNMFKGTIEGTTIQTTEGDNTNYYLSDGESGVGFYKVQGSVTLKANRAYLSVPTEIPAVGTAGSTETIKVSAAGQVPYYNSQSLDFSSLDAQGVKAYTATGYDYTSGTIWLTRVKQVPAETGILIMAPQGEYPVPTASVASVYANMFKGTLTGTTIQTHETIAGEDYINYYLSSGDAGVGFYKVTKEEGVTIGANRCYLPIKNKEVAGTRSASSGRTQIVFEEADEVIGIPLLRGIGDDNGETTNLTPALSKGEGEWYTLQGQRVAKPGKGLYIRNGKKVVIK